MTKLIRTFYYILFFATPLVMFSKTSEIFEFNKLIFIYCMTVLIAGAWLIQLLTGEKIKRSLNIFHWIVLGFILSQILSTIFSIDPHTSIFGYYGRFNGGLLSIIAYSVLFFVFLSESTLPFIKNILKVSITSSIVVMLWGLPGKFNLDLTCGLFTGTFNNSCWTNQFQPDVRMFSTLGQPNWLGAYLAVTFFLGLYFYLKDFLNSDNGKQLSKHVLWLGYLLFSFATILFTGSRSALIAVVAGLALFPLLLLSFKNKDFFNKNIKQFFIVALLLIVPILFFKTGIEKVDNYLPFHQLKPVTIQKVAPSSNASPNDINITDSLDIRKIVWKGAWRLALKYPLFGSGVETFAYSYYFTRPIEHNATSEWDFLYNKAHNEYMNYLATTGFIGFSTYMIMILAVIFAFTKRYFQTDQTLKLSEIDDVDYKLLLLCVFLGYITILITNFVGFSTTTISLFFYILPVAFLVKNSNEPSQSFVKKNISLLKKGAVVGVSIAVIGGMYFVASYWIADMKYATAQSDMRSGDYSQAAYTLLNTLKFHYEHVYEDKLSVALIGTALSSDNKADIQKLTFMSQFYNEKSLLASPYNVLYWKTQATILYNIYQLNSDNSSLKKAISALKTAEKLAPTDPRLPYSAAQYASALYDATKQENILKDAQNEINKALALRPKYPEALDFKAALKKKNPL